MIPRLTSTGTLIGTPRMGKIWRLVCWWSLAGLGHSHLIWLLQPSLDSSSQFARLTWCHCFPSRLSLQENDLPKHRDLLSCKTIHSFLQDRLHSYNTMGQFSAVWHIARNKVESIFRDLQFKVCKSVFWFCSQASKKKALIFTRGDVDLPLLVSMSVAPPVSHRLKATLRVFSSMYGHEFTCQRGMGMSEIYWGCKTKFCIFFKR